jgi:LysM repeat protein
MRRKGLILLVFSILVAWKGFAQQQPIILAYIDNYKELAIAEMQRTGVPASITLAQGIHETMAGTSDLVQASNNHFGIKCKTGWSGPSVRHDDDERAECFRKYDTAEDSYKDHSDFLKNNQRYSFLFSIDPMDFEAWAKGLKTAGYATSPVYSQVLIKLIRDYKLQQYTYQALGLEYDSVAANQEFVTDSLENVADAPEKNISNGSAGKVHFINGVKAVYVPAGTPYLAVAEKNKISVAHLFEYNEMKASIAAKSNQYVFIQRKHKAGPTAYYVVKKGETLWDIAQKNGIKLSSLASLNKLSTKTKKVAVGTKLKLQSKTTVVSHKKKHHSTRKKHK